MIANDLKLEVKVEANRKNTLYIFHEKKIISYHYQFKILVKKSWIIFLLI